MGFHTQSSSLWSGGVIAAAGSAIDRIRINRIAVAQHGGRAVWTKERRAGVGCILATANVFFRMAGNPVQVLRDRTEWHNWEIESFRMLHGEEFSAFSEGGVLIMDALPGRSLSDHLRSQDLSEQMCAAAGEELRRAHAFHSAWFDAEWSHGDPHLGNFIYSPEDGRARLIDFEVIHYRSLPALDRHADDLLVFLLDLCGRIPLQRWLPLGLAFVNGYGMPFVQQKLQSRLRVPGGVAGLWWAIRSTYMNRAELACRLEQLRSAL